MPTLDDDDLDFARAAEAVSRLCPTHGEGTKHYDVGRLAARLAREGWMPEKDYNVNIQIHPVEVVRDI